MLKNGNMPGEYIIISNCFKNKRKQLMNRYTITWYNLRTRGNTNNITHVSWPIFKKEDAMNCKNCREISLLNIILCVKYCWILYLTD